MNRTRALLSCGIVACALGLAACGSSSSSPEEPATQSGEAASSSESPIKIALLEPTSGPLATLGGQIVDAGKYAVSYVNEHGGVDGRKLQLLTYDTQLNPATASSDYQQATTQDGAVAVLGGLTSAEVTAELPWASRTSTPVLIPGAADASFTHPVKQYVFRMGSEEGQDDAAMAAMAKHLNCAKPALLYDNGALGLSTKADIAKYIPHFVASVEINGTATDLTPALQQIRQAGAECIIEGTDDLGGLGGMVQTMANTGYKVPLLGDSGVTLAPFAATAGKSLKAVPVYGTSVFDPEGSVFKTLFAEYEKQYGTALPGEESGTTWDSVQVVAAALKADGGKSGAALASAIQNVNGEQVEAIVGQGGHAPSFSATNHNWVPTPEDQLYRVLPGAPKLVATGVGG